MIMGIWRDLTAFVLLAHLVTLSRGNADEKGAFEEILARNVSIVVIENTADGPVDLQKLINATTAASGRSNSTVASKATDVVDENELVAELEEALVSAASGGQVLLISSPANGTNSSISLPGPVLVIETPAIISKSPIKDVPVESKKKKKRRAPKESFDQEIAQTQTKPRATASPQFYADVEDVETLKNILAVTEYEPQRIDAADEKIPQATSDKQNSTLQSTSRSRPEEAHYDVPRQKVARTISESSTEGALRGLASELRPVQAGGKSTSAAPVPDQKPTSAYSQVSRGPTNSELGIPPTTKSSISRRFGYSPFSSGPGLLGSSSLFEPTSTYVPGLSGGSEGRSKRFPNLTSSSGFPRKSYLSSRLHATPVLPSTYYPYSTSSLSEKPPSQSVAPTSAVPGANRRSDDYATSANEKLESFTNSYPFEFLTRYNKSPTVTRQLSKSRFFPDTSVFNDYTKEKRSQEKVKEEEEKKKEGSYEGTGPITAKLVVPTYDSYESIKQRSTTLRTTGRPAPLDYRKDGTTPIASTSPANESKEEDSSAKRKSDEERSLEASSRQASNEVYTEKKKSPVAPSAITPAYDSYEDETSSSLIVQEPHRRQRISSNSYVAPTHSSRLAFQPYTYFGRSLPSSNPTSLVDNPIYQIHGLKPNPRSVAPSNSIYNPSSNYQAKNSAAPLERQNKKVVATTAATDSYENSNESQGTTVATHRLRNPNYVDIRSGKLLYEGYNENPIKTTVTPLAPTRNQNVEYQSPHRAYNPERNSNFAATKPTTAPVNLDSGSSSNEKQSDEASYGPTENKLQAPKRANSDEEDVSASSSDNGKLVESNSANYGSRVRPQVLPEEQRIAVPYNTHATLAALAPPHNRNPQTNYAARKRLHPAELLAATSIHPHDQTARQTHAQGKKHGGGDFKHEEGGGVKHDEGHHEFHAEKGEKGYKGFHEYDKGKKGHHDKEGHDKEYAEKKGDQKKHEDSGGYHNEHHKGEKGLKEAEYSEKGEHQKGHSTKGQHIVHKKDEFEKKTEFYDESHEEDGDEKEGEYHHEHEHHEGGHEKKGHHDSAHHQDKYGEKGEVAKGHHFHEKKGHDGKDGKHHHHDHHHKHGKKGGHEEGLKWSHEKGGGGHGGGKKKGS